MRPIDIQNTVKNTNACQKDAKDNSLLQNPKPQEQEEDQADDRVYFWMEQAKEDGVED